MLNEAQSLGRYTVQESEGNRLPNRATTMQRLWTPAQGASGLVVVARHRPLAAVIGGRIVEVATGEESDSIRTGRRLAQVMLGGLVIVSNSRQKEPTRIVG